MKSIFMSITNSLRLLKLDKRVRDMIIEDKIKSGHARTLLGIEDMDMQYNVAVKVFDENLSVRQTEKLVKQINAEKDTKADKADKKDSQEELIYKNYEEKLKLAIGTKVNINHKKNGKYSKLFISWFFRFFRLGRNSYWKKN